VRLASLLGPELEETLKQNPEYAAELAEELHAVDLADLIGEFEEDERALKLLSAFPAETAAEILEVMDADRRAEIFPQLARDEAASLAELMSADDRADLFGQLDADVRTDVLGRMPKEESEDVRELLQYPEASAGGLMTTEYVALKPDMTVEEAIEAVRAVAEESETVFEAYAVDPNDTLLGAVSLRDLVLAKRGQPISEIMDPDVVSVSVEMDQEEVAQLFERYDLLALPVVDDTRKILGIVTVDDVVDVLKEEQAEDIQMMGAVAPTESSYFHTDFATFLKSRAVWLVALFVGQTFTVGLLKQYEDVVRAVTFVSFFIPLIIASAGNTGNQAASLVIRGMALNEFAPGDALRLVWREVRMGLALGGILAILGVVTAVLITSEGGSSFALAVGISLLACVTVGSVMGAGFPLLLNKLGMDPAVASGPFIASLVDVLGIVVYVQTAIWLLGV